jgi:hypothetical protein
LRIALIVPARTPTVLRNFSARSNTKPFAVSVARARVRSARSRVPAPP